MWTLLAATALADTDCPGLSVATSIPAFGAAIPIDADLVLFFENSCSSGGEDVRLEVRNGTEPIAASTFRNDLVGVAVLDPPDDLPPGADLVLRASIDSLLLVEIPFSTTSAKVQGAGEPSATVLGATWSPNLGTARLDVTARAEDPDHLAWFRVSALGDRAVTQERASLSGTQAEEPTALCASIVRVDGLGSESAPVEACAETFSVDTGTVDEAEEGSCGGGRSLLWFAGIGLLGGRSRRGVGR